MSSTSIFPDLGTRRNDIPTLVICRPRACAWASSGTDALIKDSMRSFHTCTGHLTRKTIKRSPADTRALSRARHGSNQRMKCPFDQYSCPARANCFADTYRQESLAHDGYSKASHATHGHRLIRVRRRTGSVIISACVAEWSHFQQNHVWTLANQYKLRCLLLSTYNNETTLWQSMCL
ncbi:uncharacterized protein MYCFIDRAFT_211360 [Pseudocercospora fijiensis CIRAD86]|uniref:Uncharacterized protein n=1 Tax=Pseudocercospora fijiensis (strain CIRAD86) TaxID=383855 RepID=M3AFY3_PSEFD|nr:uncharacterized protein MYCFIDRAFT_211360 [Pseudocercospora fijiensis CIRAD86]EME83501.1 hypothetical protein MYCFIDRAFT_211360 [Pseudocercospora fijiensis CIRAD86]